MKRNARKAFNALKAMGAPVYDRHEYGCQFVLGAERQTNDSPLFADYYQEEIREHVKDGKVINAWGVRQDVRDVLDANGLWDEWINAGMTGIYLK